MENTLKRRGISRTNCGGGSLEQDGRMDRIREVTKGNDWRSMETFGRRGTRPRLSKPSVRTSLGWVYCISSQSVHKTFPNLDQILICVDCDSIGTGCIHLDFSPINGIYPINAANQEPI